MNPSNLKSSFFSRVNEGINSGNDLVKKESVSLTNDESFIEL